MLDTNQIEACAAYVLEHTRIVVERCGDRPPGSEGERRAVEYVRDELAECVDKPVELETFPVAPKAFMSFPRVSGCLALTAILAYWWSPGAAVIFTGLGLVVALQEQLRYKQFLDPLFPKRQSTNLIAVQQPTGPIERRVILNAHPDAAYEWRLLYRFPRRFPVFVLWSLLCLPLLFLLDTAFWIFGNGWADGYGGLWGVLGSLQLLLLPGVLVGILFTDFRHVSPGANDNLSGVFAVAGLAKSMREAGVRLERTEVRLVITGSEEAGLRGAKAYVTKHATELRDVETISITLDTIRELEHLAVYSRDLNGTVAHDPAVCRLLKEAGARRGLALPYASIFLGASDATAFTQAGIKAAALCAMNPAPADYYHNRRDTWENMHAGCVAATLGVLAEAIHEFDRVGLPKID